MFNQTNQNLQKHNDVMENSYKDIHQDLWTSKSASLDEKEASVSKKMKELLDACERSGCCEDQCSPNCNAGCH